MEKQMNCVFTNEKETYEYTTCLFSQHAGLASHCIAHLFARFSATYERFFMQSLENCTFNQTRCNAC